MKLQHAFFILLCFVLTSFIQIDNFSGLNTNDGCKTIIDSAKIFIQTSEVAINIKPTIRDSERNLRLDKWLQKLSFKNLSCLLDNEDVSLKSIGFLYAINNHTDSLLNNYSYLLADTSAVELYMTDGSKSPKRKLGEFLSIMARQTKKDKDNFAKRPEVEEAVSMFIKKYSAYPTTYQPHSFADFSIGSDNRGLTNFKINHDYEIKNNEGKNERVFNVCV